MSKTGFQLTKNEYFQKRGVDIMAFSDFYPAGHQSGVSMIMHGKRIAANGDVRFEQTPGQWQPLPKQMNRKVDEENNTITTSLHYPDMENHLHGFNPMIYPDFEFSYEVIVKGTEDGAEIVVNLDRPIPEEFVGKMSFNLELVPVEMFGKSWIMDGSTGVFPRQPNGPTLKKRSNYEQTGKMKPLPYAHADREKLAREGKGYSPIVADDIIALPYASGRKLTVCPEEELSCFSLESLNGDMHIYDGRMNHNNGWFTISSEIPAGATLDAIHWILRPVVSEDWVQPATVQVSQVGYHPSQPKTAIIELDVNDTDRQPVRLVKLTESGRVTVLEQEPAAWGHFLRYNYLTFDFSSIKEEGLYQVMYGSQKSATFRIAEDVYERGVWQPVLEYFLPVQMCHMRVSEKYRVWHGCCHRDDARMAPINYEQFDGAAQGPSTYTKYQSGEHISGLNEGGWHDAGDFDLRIESQTGEMYNLAMAYEEFGVYLDETTVDQVNKITEIHQPDGKNDILQQIEHGALSVAKAYKSLGRLYHEIMCGDLRQYVLLGDPVNMTPGTADNDMERLVFTEDNPPRELSSAAHLAGTYRALKDLNPELAKDCLDAAKELFEVTGTHSGVYIKNDYDGAGVEQDRARDAKVHAAVELFLSTMEDGKTNHGCANADSAEGAGMNGNIYRTFLLDNIDYIVASLPRLGWMICRCIHKLGNEEFVAKVREGFIKGMPAMEKESQETPYGIPYRPNVWGAGWAIQGRAAAYYHLHKAFPDLFPADPMFKALDFILGCHPGSNTASFASGVGSKSATIAYGMNRADWSYIPGGVISGTALIRPDFPELLEFPFLWQQGEYVIGGGSTNYLFLVLAVRNALELK